MNPRAPQPKTSARSAPDPRSSNEARARIAPPAPPANFDKRLQQLADGIEQFRVDTERFFGGGLALPPEELRTRLQATLRELRGVQLRAAAEQYRLGALEARFNSLSELFGRRLRDREEGRGHYTARITPPPPEARFDARAGIVVRDAGESAAVEAIWSGLAAAGGGRRLELETFRGFLGKQIDEIRAKTGAASVQFRVVEEDGKLKLKAKPVDRG